MFLKEGQQNLNLLSVFLFLCACTSSHSPHIFCHDKASVRSYMKTPQEAFSDLPSLEEIKASKIVLVGGCFDVLHYGHMEFLRKSKEAGDYLIVAIEPDESIRNYKKREPIHNQHQRANNLASIRYVDEVILLPVMKGFDDYNELVQKIKPSVIALTHGDPQLKNKQKQAEFIGAKALVVTDHIGSFSSSAIIQALSD